MIFCGVDCNLRTFRYSAAPALTCATSIQRFRFDGDHMMEDATAIADLHGDSQWATVARDNWLASAKPVSRVQTSVIEDELWSPLLKENFAHRDLQALENLQVLERYLWPGFTDDASDHHVLLIAFVLNIKRSENLPSWSILDRPADFSDLFRRFLSLSVD